MGSLVLRLVSFILSLSLSTVVFSQASPKLREDEAKLRKSQVKDLSYKVNLSLSESDPEFSGVMTLAFDFKGQGPLRIDFTEGKVVSVMDRQGKALPFAYDRESIQLAKGVLPRGPNEITIRYTAPYSVGRYGLFRYKDNLDGRVYVFSDFQPYDANRLYPLFDQPDLRAPLTLEVEVPESWQVVSTTLERSVEKAGPEGRRLWKFPPTPSIAPYLYSLHAGPFTVWKDSASQIPSRLFSRASQAKDVRYEEWFAFTRYALDYFTKLTGIPYPFGKIDQMLVPEFRGGMENVAAVTYSELFIFPGVRTDSDRFATAGLIMHELAHMWFGNLVTASWWDDLWLNESFASYMEALAMAEHPEFVDVWERSHGRKVSGLRADSYPTTHPIVQAVPDTNSTNFDRITYNKGAAFLRVFHQRVGNENFKKGLNTFLKTHAYGNATLADWVRAYEKASGPGLKKFVDSWVLTAGANTLSAERVCGKDGKLQKLFIVQTATQGLPTLREHTNAIDLYSINGNKAEKYASLRTRVSGSRTSVTVQNMKCPDLVFLNADDSAFAHFQWSSAETDFLLKYGEQQDEVFLKLNALTSLFTEAEMGRIAVSEYFALLLRVIEKERNSQVLEFALRRISLLRRLYLGNLADLEKRRALAVQAAEALDRGFRLASRSESDKITVFGEMLSMLLLAEDKQRLESLWEKPETAQPGLGPNSNRWALLQALQWLGSNKVKAWAEQQKNQDKTNAGESAFLTFEAISWPYEKKVEALTSIVAGTSSYRIAEINSILEASYHPVRRQEFARFVQENYLDLAQTASQKSPIFVALAFSNILVPTLCDASDKLRYEKLLSMSWTKNISDAYRDFQETSRRCSALKY